MSRGAAPYPSRKFQWKNTTKHGGHFPPPDHSQFIAIQNFIRVFRGYRTAARPPNGDGCHPACITLASGLFAAGGCGVPGSPSLHGHRENPKGIACTASPPPSLYRKPGNLLQGAPQRRPLIRPHGERKKTGKETTPYSPGRRGTRGTHYQVGNIRSYLFNNITVYSFFLQSPRKRFSVPPASCRPASGLDVSKEASPAGTMTSPAGHTPTGLPLRLSPR